MKIAFACDHGGYVLRDAVLNFLRSKGIEVHDLGPYEYDKDDDYPDAAYRVAEAIVGGVVDLGVLACGTGFGIAIAANKLPGIRAIPCNSPDAAHIAKAHNNINVLTMGGRLIKPEEVGAILDAWLETQFEGGRHIQRINKIAKIEKATLNIANQNGGHVMLFNHPLVQHKIGLIRDSKTTAKEVRELIKEVTGLMAYEITRNLPLTDKEIETPLAKTTVKTIEGKKLAIVPILRAGLGMVDGILNVIPNAKVGHIGLYREETTLEPVEYYCKLPFDIEEREIFVLDPMLATGGSASAAISLIKERGGKKISLVSLFAAPDGIERMHKDHPDVSIFIAALDSHLNEHGYIVPGLGDAGDRLFGTK